MKWHHYAVIKQHFILFCTPSNKRSAISKCIQISIFVSKDIFNIKIKIDISFICESSIFITVLANVSICKYIIPAAWFCYFWISIIEGRIYSINWKIFCFNCEISYLNWFCIFWNIYLSIPIPWCFCFSVFLFMECNIIYQFCYTRILRISIYHNFCIHSRFLIVSKKCFVIIIFSLDKFHSSDWNSFAGILYNHIISIDSKIIQLRCIVKRGIDACINSHVNSIIRNT